jgi:hypothetical protein
MHSEGENGNSFIRGQTASPLLRSSTKPSWVSRKWDTQSVVSRVTKAQSEGITTKEGVKLINGTQSVRLSERKANPTELTSSQQVRSEPACISVMKRSGPGVVRGCVVGSRIGAPV